MMRIGSCAWPINVTKRCYNLPITYLTKRRFVRLVSSPEDASYQVKESRAQARRRKTGGPYDYYSEEATFARHVLRTILRECSYLPDSSAADHIKRKALARFRENAYKAWKDREQFEAQYKTRRKEAKQAISTLQRANTGNRDCLLKVLHTAYGRIGKRRHELMRPLLYVKGMDEISKATVGSDTATSENEDALLNSASVTEIEQSTQQAFPKLSVTTPLDLTPQLRALLKSQIRVKPPNTVRSNPKRIEPVIPELNSWHRPMPQKRIRNARRKQYAMLLERVQPPLPTEEWERLRDLALGKMVSQLPVPGRQTSEVSIPEDQAAHESQEAREVSALEMVARYGRPPKKAIKKGKARELNPRFMQRLYAEVFSQCPLMEWNSATEEWSVTWGFQVLLQVDQSARKVDGTENGSVQSLDAAVAAITQGTQVSGTTTMEARG